jgi:hypothetical protein
LSHQRAIKDLIAAMTDERTLAYGDWRAACSSVRHAYERWSTASRGCASLAFAAYRAALDREEHASKCVAALATSALAA